MISRPSYGWYVAASAFFTLLIAVGLPFLRAAILL
jgi:hypothetical protein